MVVNVGATEGGRAAAGLVVRVALVEGECDAPCEICDVRPTAIVVRVWEEDPEAGATGPVERHPFCAQHKGAAGALYHELTR